MTPLRLQLRNFLSYGEDAPVLDFTEMHVACLSGGNGQGKSALLDAMTWAVWGEARKSSEARKPDEELLRIGARSMEVAFDFEAGGVVHRIVRSYTQSASGKTSKPGLELQVRDGDDWQAMTAGSVRDTQAAIDERVGIDYETFINSTFLLQGRSDEFTKKKPGERKEILGKILALGRYEAMATAAGKRWSALREQATALEATAERLAAALEPVGEWEAEQEAVQNVVATASTAVEAAAAAEAEATTRLATLDASAREAEAITQSIADLRDRMTRLDEERTRILAKIEAADALVADADRIEADHARYEALRTQRSAFDEKATLFRGVDAQRHAAVLDLERRKADAQRDIDAQVAAIDRLDRQMAADREALATRDKTTAALEAAESAVSAVTRLDALRAERDAWSARVNAIDKLLAAEKGALEGKRAQIVAEGKRLAESLGQMPAIDREALQAAVAAAEAARRRRDELQVEGTEAAARVQSLDARLRQLERDRSRLDTRRQRLAATQDSACPTCGTDLTDEHRATVLAGYAEEEQALEAEQAATSQERAEAVAARDALRRAFVALGETIDAGEAAAASLASAHDLATRRSESEARLERLRAEVRDLKEQIASEAYSPELRAERATLTDRLAASAYDAAAHEAARRDAALRDHWASQARALSVASERLAEAEADRERRVAALAAARAALDDGATLADATRRIEALDAQLAAIDYDPAAHERVGRDLDALADAPRRLSALLDARRQRADLAERRTRLADDRASLERESAAQASALEALRGVLAGRAEAEAARTQASEQRSRAAASLAEAQGRLGALTERLARAEVERTRLGETRKELREVKKQRALYGHLRRAFGKNGIPSLIIEETLPEIEMRANDLLDRLSRGQTRVALETLKDKKSGGGTRETLDIRITDEQGVARAYETFSGGEAFRVNFALRIALSQMLAERSGTQIRTLVIDEGFGTQDADGLQSLIGAIRAIQDDFETILVITHLDELKDAFPVRIEVRKEPVTGSTFDIVGA